MNDALDREKPAFRLPRGAQLVLACGFDVHSIATVRHEIVAHAPDFGLAEPHLSDFVLAVNEVTSNAVRHGGGKGRLRLWQSLVNLVCEVDDDGAAAQGEIERRTRERPDPPVGAEGGRGLWLARRLCDTVSITATAAGTSVVLAFSAHLR
jgi:anti-sigma regulatory factor (Ser/Thr protein kinase)